MKTGKRIIGICLIVVLALCSPPVNNIVGIRIKENAFGLSASAASDFTSGIFEYKIQNDETARITGLTVDKDSIIGHVDLPRSLGGYTVSAIASSVFQRCKYLTSVFIPKTLVYYSHTFKDSGLTMAVIEDGSTNISSYGFSGAKQLVDISIPDSVCQFGTGAFQNCESLTSFIIPKSVTKLGMYTFQGCDGIKSIVIPNGVEEYSFAFKESGVEEVTIESGATSIDGYGFAEASFLTDINIPNTVTIIGGSAFQNCKSLSSFVIPKSVTNMGMYVFDGCEELKGILIHKDLIDYAHTFKLSEISDVIIEKGATRIDAYGFTEASFLTNITIPNTVIDIGTSAFSKCEALSDVFFMGTKNEWDVINIKAGNECLTNATIHFNVSNNNEYYTFGEETYGFHNYSDDHSSGHCFGMSATSSMYFLGLLDQSLLGDSTKKLVSYSDTSKVRKPICHYQKIQGSYARKAIVAGGYYYKSNSLMKYFGVAYNMQSDWNEVINYVKNHNHDNKGTLQIGYRGRYRNKKGKVVEGGHAINFLRYEVVGEQERIYAYDNNCPDYETYFYKDSAGNIQQAPYASFSVSITSIALRDVKEYFKTARKYKQSFIVYALQEMIAIDVGEQSVMDGDYETSALVMFEIPEDQSKIIIKPLVDNAEFTYMDQTYSFGEIDENTYGILTLAESEDGVGELKIETEPEPHTHTYTATVTTPATCTEPGVMTYTCADGDDTYTETIPATGHVDDNNDGHCDACGEQMTGGDHCKFCGKIHNGGFFDKLTGFFHKIFAIFKR